MFSAMLLAILEFNCLWFIINLRYFIDVYIIDTYRHGYTFIRYDQYRIVHSTCKYDWQFLLHKSIPIDDLGRFLFLLCIEKLPLHEFNQRCMLLKFCEKVLISDVSVWKLISWFLYACTQFSVWLWTQVYLYWLNFVK